MARKKKIIPTIKPVTDPDIENDDAGPLWRADWDGAEGDIQTGAVADSFNPHDFSTVLTALGYTPGEIKMELTASTRWEQRTARRNEQGLPTGEYETVWLNAYRYKATRDVLAVDLPALYAETAKKRKAVKRTPPVGGDSTVVVCWADIQTGKVDELGGLQELLERLDEKRARLDDYLREEPFDHVVVVDVGDILEGFENTSSQSFTNCLSLMDQVDVAATEFWKTIRLAEEFAPVDVISIPSNHAQWRAGKGLLGKPTDDWGIHINKRLERQNEDAKLDVTFHRPDDWSENIVFEVKGTRLGVAHGHQARNPDKVKDWWAKMTHGGVMECDVLLTGHYHFASLRPVGKNYLTGKSRWHVQAPTLDNGSAWVRNAMGEDGDPALCVFKIDTDGFDVQSFRLL